MGDLIKFRKRNNKALFYDSHPRLDGSTFDNKEPTPDITYATFWTNLIATAKLKYIDLKFRKEEK